MGKYLVKQTYIAGGGIGNNVSSSPDRPKRRAVASKPSISQDGKVFCNQWRNFIIMLTSPVSKDSLFTSYRCFVFLLLKLFSLMLSSKRRRNCFVEQLKIPIPVCVLFPSIYFIISLSFNVMFYYRF